MIDYYVHFTRATSIEQSAPQRLAALPKNRLEESPSPAPIIRYTPEKPIGRGPKLRSHQGIAMGLFYDIYLGSQVTQAGITAQQGARKAEDAQATTQRLEERVDRLVLINMALWSLLKEATGLTDEQLNERVREIDLSDGYLDGRVRTAPQQCPNCQRTLDQKHHRCLYCGYQAQGGDAFAAAAP